MKMNLSSLSVLMLAAMFNLALVSCSPSEDDVMEQIEEMVKDEVDGNDEETTTEDDKLGGVIPNISKAVDLGLSVKWAPWNIGASKPSDYGELFAWGEVSPKKDEKGNYKNYDWTTYTLGYENGDEKVMSKYNETDGKTILESSDDAATANWGGRWRTPTLDELTELLDNCEWSWTENYEGSGNNGYAIKSKKAGYEEAILFLPAAGICINSDHSAVGSYGCYWASDLEADDVLRACIFSIGTRGSDVNISNFRFEGLSVRAVCHNAE